MSLEQWKSRVKKSDIRCQWDPEKDIWGDSLPYRSIQLGLRGDAVYAYVNEWIVHIEDITDYVTDLYEKRERGEDIRLLLPKEQVYVIEY